MLGIALLALSLILGSRIVRAVDAPIGADVAWVAGPVLGVALGSWTAYAAGSIFGGLTTRALIAATGLMAVTSAALEWWCRRRRIEPVRPEPWLLWSAIALGVFFLALNWYGILRADSTGTVTSVGNAWADIPFHTGIVTSFAYRDNFPPTYAIALHAPLGYPFLVDLASGGVLAGGLPLKWAIVAVNVVVQVAYLAGFMVLVRTLTRSVRAAVLSGVVLLFLGNFGFLAVPHDIRAAGGIGRWLAALPWDYTGESLGTQGRARLGIGVYLGNPTFEFLVPRRSGAFGLAAGMPVLGLAAEMVQRPATRTAVLLGTLAGLLPRIHAHTAISLAIVVAVWLALDRLRSDAVHGWFRRWALAGVVAAVVALPQVLAMRRQASMFFTAGWLGWTGEAHDALSAGLTPHALAVLAHFWVVNGGFLVLLIPVALIASGPAMRRFWAGFGVLWVAANLVRTQPWEWDNSSYFVWWQAGTVALVGPVLSRAIGHPAFERGGWRPIAERALALIGVAGLVAGGPLSLLRTLQDRPPLWSVREAAFVDEVRRATPRDAAILTSNGHGEPVNALSGRQVVMGFSGWLGNHGLDAQRYDDDLVAMFSGDVDRMRRLGVGWIVLGPWERGFAADHHLDLGKFDDQSRFEVVLDKTIDGQRWTLLRLHPKQQHP